MKKVFTSNSEIAHLCANQVQPEARNSGNNFYFNDVIIYSYGRHFPIAKHMEVNGTKAILFTKRSYSNTTAKHISTVYHASSHFDKIMCWNVNESPLSNFERWESELNEIVKKLEKAKKPEIYLSQIESIKEEIIKYSKFLNVEIPIKIKSLIAIPSKGKYKEILAKRVELLKIEAAKKAEKLRLQHEQELSKFRLFEISRLYTRDGYDYLRFNKESNRIETSQGVQVPYDVAHNFYRWMQVIIKKGGCINCDKMLLNFQVREVKKEFLHIGCHLIAASEIERIAKELNWIN